MLFVVLCPGTPEGSTGRQDSVHALDKVTEYTMTVYTS